MKTYTYLALVPMVAMVAQAESAALSPEECTAAVEQTFARIESDDLLKDMFVNKETEQDLSEHMELLRRGKETVKDFPWLAAVASVYDAFDWDGKPVPTEIVQNLLRAGAEVNAPYDKGRTILFYDVEPEALKALLAAGADVNVRDEDGDTPLFYLHGSVERCRLLLAAGADVNARNNNQETPLHNALSRSEEEAYDTLVAAGADVNAVDKDGDTPLHSAFCCGSPVTRQKLIRGGADLKARNKNGLTPLDVALLNNEIETALEIMHAGVSPDADRYSPLALACFFGQSDDLKQLVEEGEEDIDLPLENLELTPLCLAISIGNKELFDLMLELGADPNAGTDEGVTPLHVAAGKGRVEMLKQLVAAGADVNALTEEGETPLYYAMCNEQDEAVDALLAAGVNVNRKSKRFRYIPLMKAISMNNASLVSKLIAAGAEVNVYSANSLEGGSPLAAAVEEGNMEIIDILLAAGADANDRGNSEEEPLLYSALEAGKVDIARKLLSAGALINTRNGGSLKRLLAESLMDDRKKEVVEFLLALGVRLSSDDRINSTFVKALENNDQQMCSRLLELGYTPEKLNSPLLHAIIRNQVDEVKKLLEAGASPRMEEGKICPLILAIMLHEDEVVDALMAAGVEVNTERTSSYGITPLMYAAYSGSAAICEKLLAAGANVNAVPSFLVNALGLAARQGHTEVCRLLIKAGADVNLVSEEISNATPLHMAAAAKINNTEICAMLLEAGADPNARMSDGETPLYIMMGENKKRKLSDECCQVLIKGGADVELKNRAGKRPKDMEGKTDFDISFILNRVQSLMMSHFLF